MRKEKGEIKAEGEGLLKGPRKTVLIILSGFTLISLLVFFSCTGIHRYEEGRKERKKDDYYICNMYVCVICIRACSR